MPAAVRADVEAFDQQHASRADALQSRLRHFESCAARQCQARGLEAHDVIGLITRAAGKFGQPFSGGIVYECLGSGAPGTAATLEKLPKCVPGWQRAGREFRCRCQKLRQPRAGQSLMGVRGGLGPRKEKCAGTAAAHAQKHLGQRRLAAIGNNCRS